MNGSHARLRDLRGKRGLTQRALASAAGLPEETISRVETGRHQPRLLTQQRIAEALGVERREIWPDLEEAS